MELKNCYIIHVVQTGCNLIDIEQQQQTELNANATIFFILQCINGRQRSTIILCTFPSFFLSSSRETHKLNWHTQNWMIMSFVFFWWTWFNCLHCYWLSTWNLYLLWCTVVSVCHQFNKKRKKESLFIINVESRITLNWLSTIWYSIAFFTLQERFRHVRHSCLGAESKMCYPFICVNDFGFGDRIYTFAHIQTHTYMAKLYNKFDYMICSSFLSFSFPPSLWLLFLYVNETSLQEHRAHLTKSVAAYKP